MAPLTNRSRRRAGGPARRVAVAAASVLGVLSLVAGVPPASAQPGAPSPIFDPVSVDWDFVYDRTSTQFSGDFAARKAQGYMVTDLELDPAPRPGLPGSYHVAAIFQKNTDNRAWRSLRDMDQPTFVSEYLKAKTENLRMIDYEEYRTSFYGETRYAAVWMENREHLSWEFARGMDEAGLANFIAAQKRLGRMPIDLKDVNTAECNFCYAAITVQNVEHRPVEIFTHLNETKFAEKFNQLKTANTLRPLAFQSQRHFGVDEISQRYSGIWIGNQGGRRWAEYRDLTVDQLETLRVDLAHQGFRPVAFERYDLHLKPRYAMIWRQND